MWPPRVLPHSRRDCSGQYHVPDCSLENVPSPRVQLKRFLPFSKIPNINLREQSSSSQNMLVFLCRASVCFIGSFRADLREGPCGPAVGLVWAQVGAPQCFLLGCRVFCCNAFLFASCREQGWQCREQSRAEQERLEAILNVLGSQEPNEQTEPCGLQ